MSGIRVTYTGLISFTIGIVSILTGLIFTIIVTRQLTQEEFGTWGIIYGLTAYMLIIEPIVSYWVVREIARGVKSGKTALVTSNLFSVGTIPVFLLLVYLYAPHVGIELEILFLASMLVPVRFARQALAAINYGFRPQNVAYGLLSFELTKIVVALILVYFLHMGISGVIITITIASIASIIIQVILARTVIKGSFNIRYLKKWIRLFWLPIYPRLAQIISNSDVIIFPIIVGSVENLAFWLAAIAIAGIIEHSATISKAVYPKLLGGGKQEYFQENLSRVFYFAIPLVAMSLVFARPALFTLNPLYEQASVIVIILTFVMFLRMLNGVFTQPLIGIEKVDVSEKSTFKDYIKSKLFYLPTLRLIQRISYLSLLAIVLVITVPIAQVGLDLVFYWSLVALATQAPLTLIYYILLRKDFTVNIGSKSIRKYLFSGVLVFGLTYVLMDKFLIYKVSIFEFLPSFLIFISIGVCGYLLLTYLIDSKTKKLFHSIINEIKNKPRNKG